MCRFFFFYLMNNFNPQKIYNKKLTPTPFKIKNYNIKEFYDLPKIEKKFEICHQEQFFIGYIINQDYINYYYSLTDPNTINQKFFYDHYNSQFLNYNNRFPYNNFHQNYSNFYPGANFSFFSEKPPI